MLAKIIKILITIKFLKRKSLNGIIAEVLCENNVSLHSKLSKADSMYILDQKSKTLIKAEKCTFKSLNLKERQDLQEWIAKEPSSLGEDLLIIQKEFDGFADTRERLDLLAIDKKGNLVVIENKLDDSGRDVTWQAIKYASYCSSLSKQDVINIFQKYLGTSGSAVDTLSEFFDNRDIEDIEINKGNSQRIILVAANFHKEVTSSVLWLQNFNLRIKCFKVTPYKYGDQVMVEFDQIIPIEDTEEFQIKIANKEQEESVESESTQIRYRNRHKFWSEFIEYSKTINGLYAASTAVTDNWMGKSVRTMSGGSINVIINKDNCRVELYINSGEQARNKEIFDKLAAHKSNIDAQINGLEWQRMDDKVTCRVRLDMPYSYLNPDDKQRIFNFFVEKSQEMMDLFTKISTKLNLK